jgi:acetyl esterase/lipase
MKKLLAALAIGATAVVVRRYLAVRDALAAVPAELRSPLLPLMTTDVTARSLRWHRLVYLFSTPPGRGVRMTRHRVDGRLLVLVLSPTASAGGRRPALLYIHGGGMITGSPKTEASGSGQLARELNAVVVSPDYRLAPEHPYPAALDDCMAALHWMLDNAEELGIHPDRIAVTGSSAGGGLAAAVAQRAHDEGIALRAQALVYPMLDDRTALRDAGGRGRFMWTPESNRFGWTAYLGREARMSDAPEYSAPARREDLSGLAPAWVGVGDLDLFYDESVDYARRLQAAGVDCELVTVPGMYHGADGLARKNPSMKAFRRGVVDHLRAHLVSPPC